LFVVVEFAALVLPGWALIDLLLADLASVQLFGPRKKI
jgi:hypothetical protein